MKNPIITIISFLLCIILFIAEILFMTLFNISHGITKTSITNIIEQVDIKKELNEIETYKELKQEINEELLNELILSQETEKYIKENINTICQNAIYNENKDYTNSIKLKEELNNKIDSLIGTQEMTIEQKEKIVNVIDEIIISIENQMESINDENQILQIVRILVNKKTTNYILFMAKYP